jgi:hypothetical protein
MTITDIITEFQNKIDNEKTYDLKDMTQILTEVYKESKKTGKKTKSVNITEKKAPTAYNNFMSERMKALKKETPDVSSKELMKMASVEWKDLTDEKKQSYKV